jgi:photosystem II stability/assembly factor-like uncharacterized protein
MMKYVFLILFFIFSLSCDRYADPSFERLESYSFGFLNKSGQRFFAGDSFTDTIKYRVVKYTPAATSSFKVIFDVAKGGGSLSLDSTSTESNGMATTSWQLGSESFDQILRASAFDLSGKYLTSTDFTVYGFRTNEWDTFTGAPDGNMTGMATDTINGITLMITNGKVYKQGNRYFDWEEIVDPVLKSPRTIEIDGNGVIYVSTWDGEVLKSNDHGESWRNCTKPYPDNPYYIYMHVSNDNYIWIYKFDYPTKYSKDGGNTWLTAGSGLSSYGFGDVFRLKNGSLLFHGSNCCSLSRSDDDGATWTHIATPGLSTKLYVNEKDEIFICTQLSGCWIYKSTDMGATFQSVYGVSPVFGTTMDNVFNKWKDFYYILIPGY